MEEGLGGTDVTYQSVVERHGVGKAGQEPGDPDECLLDWQRFATPAQATNRSKLRKARITKGTADFL